MCFEGRGGAESLTKGGFEIGASIFDAINKTFKSFPIYFIVKVTHAISIRIECGPFTFKTNVYLSNRLFTFIIENKYIAIY